MFLRKGELMKCMITELKCSSDLVQGGIEFPCKLTFSGEERNLRKLQGLLPSDSAVCVLQLLLTQNRKTMVLGMLMFHVEKHQRG